MACHLKRHENHCKQGNEKKLVCEICGKYVTNKVCNMKKHRLVCLKRLTEGVFDHDMFVPNVPSNSSRISEPDGYADDISLFLLLAMPLAVEEREISL